MNIAADTGSVAVLRFGARQLPGPLNGLPVHKAESAADVAAIDAAVGPYQRLVVVGTDADLAAVLTLLLRAGRLDVEVGYAPRRRTTATRVYRVPAGRRAARRARRGSAQRVPLIRDETGSAIVGAAHWHPTVDAQLLHGEAVVDDAVLFDGDVAGVRIEPHGCQAARRAAGWPVERPSSAAMGWPWSVMVWLRRGRRGGRRSTGTPRVGCSSGDERR